MKIKIGDLIPMLVGTLASVVHLDHEKEVEFSMAFDLDAYNPPVPFVEECPLILGIEDLLPDELVHFQYEKDGKYKPRIGYAVKTDYMNRRTMIWEIGCDHPKWFKWDKTCSAYLIRDLLS